MRPVAHPVGCHKYHDSCDYEDAWCIKCGTRYTPPEGYDRAHYICLQCRTAPVPA